MRKLEDILKKCGDKIINKDSQFYINNLTRLENKEIQIKKQLNEKKRSELNRINKEFEINNYERRFNITKEKVVSVIVGESNTPMEIIKLKRDQKVII